MAVWLVRSGKYGEREDIALEKKIAVIGWDELPDLSAITTREQLRQLLTEIYPEEKPKTLINWESQIWPFLKGMENNDIIAMPLKSRSTIAIGRVSGPYEYHNDLPANIRHSRKVNWIKELPRNLFDQDLLYSLGAFMTICRIQRNNAEERINALLSGKAQSKLTKKEEKQGLSTSLEEEGIPDLEEIALDQVRSYISRKFRGHELTRLVGSVLQAQAYQVQVSRPGADGGVDIIAGKGLLGFDHPRLVVQVKSGDNPVDIKIVRELQGVMKNFQADHGLLVSWGGFSGTVPKETATKFFEIRLWNSDDLIQMIQSHYENISDDMKADLPMKRIWTLVMEGAE